MKCKPSSGMENNKRTLNIRNAIAEKMKYGTTKVGDGALSVLKPNIATNYLIYI